MCGIWFRHFMTPKRGSSASDIREAQMNLRRRSFSIEKSFDSRVKCLQSMGQNARALRLLAWQTERMRRERASPALAQAKLGYVSEVFELCANYRCRVFASVISDDLSAYILSWGFRTKGLVEPRREELDPFVAQIARLRHKAIRTKGDRDDFAIWSVAVIPTLHPRKR